MAELDTLFRQLDAIEAACGEQRWEEAESLMQAHDLAVRAVAPGSWTPADLNALIARQQTLAELMRGGRDEASAELGQLGASKRGAKAYGG